MQIANCCNFPHILRSLGAGNAVRPWVCKGVTHQNSYFEASSRQTDISNVNSQETRNSYTL